MITSSVFIALVIMIETGPIYTILPAHFKAVSIAYLQWVWVVCSFIGVIIINVFPVKRPMLAGLKALNRYEGCKWQ